MQPYRLVNEFGVFLEMLNQIFEIEKKLEKLQEGNSIYRNLNRLKEMLENQLPFEGGGGFVMENPLGQPYDETRIDCEANISGEEPESLIIIEVIKPIIRLKRGGYNQLVQKGLVIAKSSKSQ